MSGERKRINLDDIQWMEDPYRKKSLLDRVKEDPLVPLGCLLTAGVLMGGLSTFRKGQSKLGNKFMQARVVVQASTVLAMSSGAYFASHKTQEEKRKSYEERVQLELRK